MRLVYHSIGTDKATSPFDAALQSVAAQAPILRLASPYIGLGFLLRTVESAGEWRLLSDVEAWLQSGNQMHRAKCWEFIADNLARIRHVPDLHAKVAIGNGTLFLGSANFTEKGVLGRAEMSVLIEESAPVAEAIAWFDALWAVASAPILEEGDALVSALDAVAWTRPRVRSKLTATAPKVSAVLTQSRRPEGFDLAGAMAKAGLEESSRLMSLEAAYQQVSEQWFSMGREFTFAEMLAELRTRSVAPVREVWRLITTETVNHWLGGLEPGYDRYMHEGGRFRPYHQGEGRVFSAAERGLGFILEHIPALPDSVPLPLESVWSQAGITEFMILPTVQVLLDRGLLIEHDIPGEVERYSVDPEFEWPRRWLKFVQSHARFERIHEAHLARPKAAPKKDPLRSPHKPLGEHIQANSQRLAATPAPKNVNQAAKSASIANVRKYQELAQHARLHGLDQQAMLEQHDIFLAALIETLMQQGVLIRDFARNEIKAAALRARLVPSLAREIGDENKMLAGIDFKLVFNPKWDGEYFLSQYLKARDLWRRAVRGG